ncbi:unnamed protein product, partial [Prorocentrum cordatum]
ALIGAAVPSLLVLGVLLLLAGNTDRAKGASALDQTQVLPTRTYEDMEDCSEALIHQACLDFLESYKNTISAEILASVARGTDGSSAKILAMVDEFRKESQLDATNKNIKEAQGRLDERDDQLAAPRAEMAEFRHLLAVAEQKPRPAPLVHNGFERDIDPAQVVAFAQRHTTLEAVKSSLSPWAAYPGLEEPDCEFKALGNLPAERFAIQFAVRRLRMTLTETPPSSKIFMDRGRGALSVGRGRVARVEAFPGE